MLKPSGAPQREPTVVAHPKQTYRLASLHAQDTTNHAALELLRKSEFLEFVKTQLLELANQLEFVFSKINLTKKHDKYRTEFLAALENLKKTIENVQIENEKIPINQLLISHLQTLSVYAVIINLYSNFDIPLISYVYKIALIAKSADLAAETYNQTGGDPAQALYEELDNEISNIPTIHYRTTNNTEKPIQAFNLKNMHILVYDDSDGTQQWLKEGIMAFGGTHSQSKSEAECLEQIKSMSDCPIMVIVDFNLGSEPIKGLETALKIKKEDPCVTILFHTSESFDKNTITALVYLGIIEGYVQKPINALSVF